MDPAWTRTPAAFDIGGITDVGFAEDDSLLLVLSHSGRGVIDCTTGERVARDHLDDWSFLDEASGQAEGIGPLAGQLVLVAGLMSNRFLTRTSPAGWELAGLVAEAGVNMSEDSWMMMDSIVGVELTGPSGQVQQVLQSVLEIRAFGFGSTGRRWVLATTASVDFFDEAPSSPRDM